MPSEYIYTQVGDQKIKLSNLEKTLYPSKNITKAEIIQYYLSIAKYMLPLVSGRALTLIRFPDGIDKHSFYTKNKPDWTPEWIPQIKTPWDDENTYIFASKPQHLVWLANLAALEIHNINSKTGSLLYPDHFIIDLDPSEGQDFQAVKQMAFDLKLFLEPIGYHPLVKTSGGKGLHLWVPIKKDYSYDQMLDSSKKLMKTFEKKHSNATLRISKQERTDKILLDIYRNHPANTTASPFSLRGKPGAPVSMPISWADLENISSSQTFDINNALNYIEKNGNPWEDLEMMATPLHNQISHAPLKTSPKIKVFDRDILKARYNHMLCESTVSIPNIKANFSYEIKWDGIRVFIHIDRGKYKIISRSGRDITEQFPDFQDGQLLNISQAIIDGELVCLNKSGISNFSDIISRMHSSGTKKIKQLSKTKKAYLYAFDCLVYDDKDIRQLSLIERRRYLMSALANHPRLKNSDTFQEPELLLSQAEALGLEGIIIKDNQSKYLDGTRSQSWLKLKFRQSIDCHIIGYTKGKGDRASLFGSLHLATLENNEYIYRGRVGSGFNHDKIKSILNKLTDLDTTTKPVDDKIDEEKNSVWVKPIYSCEVQYASMTNNGTLREPVFVKIFKTA